MVQCENDREDTSQHRHIAHWGRQGASVGQKLSFTLAGNGKGRKEAYDVSEQRMQGKTTSGTIS